MKIYWSFWTYYEKKMSELSDGWDLNILEKYLRNSINGVSNKHFCNNKKNPIVCIAITESREMVKLKTLVEGDPKAPFSIATTPRYSRGGYSFPWIAPLYPWSIPYNPEC